MYPIGATIICKMTICVSLFFSFAWAVLSNRDTYPFTAWAMFVAVAIIRWRWNCHIQFFDHSTTAWWRKTEKYSFFPIFFSAFYRETKHTGIDEWIFSLKPGTIVRRIGLKDHIYVVHSWYDRWRFSCTTIRANFCAVCINAIINTQWIKVTIIFDVKIGEIHDDGFAQRRFNIIYTVFIVFIAVWPPWWCDDTVVIFVPPATNWNAKSFVCSTKKCREKMSKSFWQKNLDCLVMILSLVMI